MHFLLHLKDNMNNFISVSKRYKIFGKCLQMVNLSWFHLQIVVNLILLWPAITLIPLVTKPLDP